MKPAAIIIGALMSALILAGAASAQVIPPGGSQFNPPLPSAPPIRAPAPISDACSLVFVLRQKHPQ
jgi:hypothetical protein